jgi:hypothetical protein
LCKKKKMSRRVILCYSKFDDEFNSLQVARRER